MAIRKIEWTDYALDELKSTFQYLELNFSDREMKNLAVELEVVLKLIANNPKAFQKTDVSGVRRVVIKKYNTLFYRESNNRVEVLSFFSNRQDPNKLSL